MKYVKLNKLTSLQLNECEVYDDLCDFDGATGIYSSIFNNKIRKFLMWKSSQKNCLKLFL